MRKPEDFPRTNLICTRVRSRVLGTMTLHNISFGFARYHSASALVSLSRKIFIRVSHRPRSRRNGRNRLDPSASLVLVLIVYAEPARARAKICFLKDRCGCTSFHSRCLRHTFTKLNWFSRTTHVHAGSCHRRVQWQVPVVSLCVYKVFNNP